MNIFVGCSSCEIEEYKEVAFNLGDNISKNGDTLVFGASYIGLMKELVDGIIKNKGEIIGVVPECYKEVAYDRCSQLILTKTVSERKIKIFDCADAFVFLPGGFGTMDELLSIFEEKRAGCINKPIIIINPTGHFDKFMEFANELVYKKFARKSDVDLISIVSSVEEAISYLR